MSAATTEHAKSGTTSRDRGNDRHGVGGVGREAERIAIA
jgi:hypothetical protein